MAIISVTNQWTKKNVDFVFYNYLAEKKNITIEECQKDFEEKYSIILSSTKMQKMFSEYVKRGLIKQCFRNYEFIF